MASLNNLFKATISVSLLVSQASSTASCADFTDSDTCISHKDLVGMHSCTFCVEDQQCHAVGSTANPCSDECCASVSSLSTCDYESVDEVDGAACNGTWSVKTFAPGSDALKTTWPETGRTNGKGSALHFSGGGSRAMTMGLGQTRALYELGLLENVEYMVGVSGGGWWTSSFTYDQNPYDDATRLCPYVEPANLTDDFLGNIPEGCMLTAPQCHFYECIALEAVESVIPWNVLSRVYVDCVHKCYLKPFGIDRSDFYTLSGDDISQIKSRNPNLQDENFLLPSPYAEAKNRPYMILQGTLVGPEDVGHLEQNKTFVPVELSALGSGISHEQVIEYAPKVTPDIDDDNGLVPVKVGGMMESFGFGAAATTLGVSVDESGVGEGYVGVTALGNKLDRNSLSLSAGITSMAPEALFAEYGPSTDYVLIGGDLWPADEGDIVYDPNDNDDGDNNHTFMLLGDGGDLDNFGIFSTLRRGVPRMAVFMNTDTPLNNSWDPTTRPPTSKDIDGYFCAMFGFQVFEETNNMYYTFNNQIFPSEDFVPIVQALQNQVDAGNAAVYTSTLTTIENVFMGIPAGLEVTILWDYSSLPTRWFNQLPSSLQDEINLGDKGPYLDFPYYSIAHIALSAQQVNLLANLCTWIVSDNKDQFAQIFQ
mmetsp:Transcript_10363/g.12570  ORF Transcript_10363/g.12570 Transcript_10363/m.12570 type:complete len:651 (+) Transcript_10363:90-2042(+)